MLTVPGGMPMAQTADGPQPKKLSPQQQVNVLMAAAIMKEGGRFDVLNQQAKGTNNDESK